MIFYFSPAAQRTGIAGSSLEVRVWPAMPKASDADDSRGLNFKIKISFQLTKNFNSSKE